MELALATVTDCVHRVRITQVAPTTCAQQAAKETQLVNFGFLDNHYTRVYTSAFIFFIVLEPPCLVLSTLVVRRRVVLEVLLGPAHEQVRTHVIVTKQC